MLQNAGEMIRLTPPKSHRPTEGRGLWTLERLVPRRIATLVFITPFLLAGAVRADLEITLREDAGPVVLVADDPVDFDPTGSTFNGTFGNFLSNIHAASSNASAASFLSLTSSLSNTCTAPHTLTLEITQNNFTLPSPSLENLKSAIGGTFILSIAGDSISQTAYANNSNGLFDTIGAASPGVQTSTSPGGNAISFSSDSIVVPFTRTSGLYSLTTVTSITLAPGSTMNFAAAPVVTPVPEPGGLSLLSLAGLLALCRRRATV
jgi:hypothetical protein